MNTSDVIRTLCARENISVTTLEREMNYGNGSLTKGNAIKSDRLFELSKRFNVTMEYLMTGKYSENEDPTLEDILNYYHQLNEEGQKKLHDYAVDLVSSGRYIKDSEIGEEVSA